MKNNVACVKLWGTVVGYLYQGKNGIVGFQYDDVFIRSGIELSPIKMPLSNLTYSFPALPEETFHGLPGMLADSLPDKFGTIVINRYLESQGREAEILSAKEQFHVQKDDTMMAQLMECGSSVGGARAKTLIAWNPETNDVRSGQIQAGSGYEYWLLKFDNIRNNRDKDSVPDEPEYTKIEYAYYLMAMDAGISMSECRIYEEYGSSHFMTKRFDRIGDKGEKLHMQSLCALAHMDFNSPRIYSYEGAFEIMKRLNISYQERVQFFKRMLFNHYAKNFDDHTKNISFLMNKRGIWSLAPAYDVTFAYKKDSIWVSGHQMLINGKADNLEEKDFYEVAKRVGIKKIDVRESLSQILNSISKWEQFAQEAKLSEYNYQKIKKLI